jgi:hypothetical protein
MVSLDVGGIEVPSLRATCSLCRHRTWSHTSNPTVAQCLEAMGRSCPRGAEHEYVAANGKEAHP